MATMKDLVEQLTAETGVSERECRIVAMSTIDKIRGMIAENDLSSIPKLGAFQKRPAEGTENRYVFKLKE